MLTRRLRWTDVRPDVRHFDPKATRRLIQRVIAGSKAKVETRDFYWLEGQVDEVLVQEFGVWISGWRSAIDGGPVTAYDGVDVCKPRRSVNQVVAAVKQWLGFLSELDTVIAEFPIRTHEDLPLQVELAANRLLAIVLKRSDAQDAWYQFCALALQWYLESQGRSTLQNRRAVATLMSGSFCSWLESRAC